MSDLRTIRAWGMSQGLCGSTGRLGMNVIEAYEQAFPDEAVTFDVKPPPHAERGAGMAPERYVARCECGAWLWRGRNCLHPSHAVDQVAADADSLAEYLTRLLDSPDALVPRGIHMT